MEEEIKKAQVKLVALQSELEIAIKENRQENKEEKANGAADIYLLPDSKRMRLKNRFLRWRTKSKKTVEKNFSHHLWTLSRLNLISQNKTKTLMPQWKN